MYYLRVFEIRSPITYCKFDLNYSTCITRRRMREFSCTVDVGLMTQPARVIGLIIKGHRHFYGEINKTNHWRGLISSEEMGVTFCFPWKRSCEP